MHVRRDAIALAIALLALIASCKSTGGTQGPGFDDGSLKVSVSKALYETEKSAFSSPIAFPYEGEDPIFSSSLPHYRDLREEYLSMASGAARDVLREVTGAIEDEMKKMDFSSGNVYAARGYSSVTDELEERLRDDVKTIFLDAILSRKEEISSIFSSMATEARLYKENSENLRLVGIERHVPDYPKEDFGVLSGALADEYFTALSENEVNERARSDE